MKSIDWSNLAMQMLGDVIGRILRASMWSCGPASVANLLDGTYL